MSSPKYPIYESTTPKIDRYYLEQCEKKSSLTESLIDNTQP